MSAEAGPVLSAIAQQLPHKRVTLFAGYDANGVIHDYVVYLIHALSRVSDVYYFCDQEPNPSELSKLDGLVQYCGGARHGRYDFGSWSMLIERLGWDCISSYDEMIIANDSIYGPMFDIAHTFDIMDRSGCDFWGITANDQISYHIQSYFMAFKRHVFLSDAFRAFWSNVDVFEDHLDFVKKHEVRLSSLLIDEGFKPQTLVVPYSFPNPSWFPAALMSKFSAPFVKVKCFKDPVANLWEDFTRLEDAIEKLSGYSYSLIERHIGKIAIEHNRENSAKFSHHIHFKIAGLETYSTGKLKVKILLFGKKWFSLKVPRTIIAWLSRRPAFKCTLAQ